MAIYFRKYWDLRKIRKTHWKIVKTTFDKFFRCMAYLGFNCIWKGTNHSPQLSLLSDVIHLIQFVVWCDTLDTICCLMWYTWYNLLSDVIPLIQFVVWCDTLDTICCLMWYTWYLLFFLTMIMLDQRV